MYYMYVYYIKVNSQCSANLLVLALSLECNRSLTETRSPFAVHWSLCYDSIVDWQRLMSCRWTCHLYIKKNLRLAEGPISGKVGQLAPLGRPVRCTVCNTRLYESLLRNHSPWYVSCTCIQLRHFVPLPTTATRLFCPWS